MTGRKLKNAIVCWERHAQHVQVEIDGNDGMRIVARNGHDSIQVGTAEAPFILSSGEDLTLRVFINDRQAVVYAVPNMRENPNIRFFADGGEATVKSLDAWNMQSIYLDQVGH